VFIKLNPQQGYDGPLTDIAKQDNSEKLPEMEKEGKAECISRQKGYKVQSKNRAWPQGQGVPSRIASQYLDP
jgi:hypothetical protein